MHPYYNSISMFVCFDHIRLWMYDDMLLHELKQLG